MRLIDANAIEKQARMALAESNPVLMGMILRWIRKQATIDAVEVVRCRDCTHITPVEGGVPLCTMHDRACGDYEFCNYGERRSK